MLKSFFNFQTKTIASASVILAASSLISGILGLFRDRLLAGRFGVANSDIYFAAFRIPDLVYNILIAGGILVSFLPLFSEYFSKDKKRAWEMANYVLNAFLFLLLALSLIFFIIAPLLVDLIVPGFDSQKKIAVVALTRFLFLSPIFLGISNIFSGILHYFNKFLIYSLSPILYNIGIIFGILFFSPYFGIFGVGFGVILGAFLHMAIQIPFAVNSGFRYSFVFDFKYPAIKKIFKLMSPRILAITAQQANFVVITAIASTIAAGSVSIFNFSNNLQGFLIGVIGVSVATASFPSMVKIWTDKQPEQFGQYFSLIFRQIIFLTIPLSVLIFILRAQIVRIILGTGQFGWTETRLTAASLGLFAVSIFAQALIPIFARAFFSFQDTRTPTLISIFSIIINIILSLLLVSLLAFPNLFSNFAANILKISDLKNISVIGLPLAFSISAIFQFIFLFLALYKKIGDFATEKIKKSFLQTIAASFFSGAGVYISLYATSLFFNLKTFWGILTQTALSAASGIFIYIAIGYFLKSAELENIKSLMLKRRK